MALRLLLSLCGLLLPATSQTQVSARDYYVSPTGHDSNRGTRAAPWQSIAKVNDTAFGSGDRICFASGELTHFECFYGAEPPRKMSVRRSPPVSEAARADRVRAGSSSFR